MPSFVDMFAGAGGFSEGFLQAEEAGKHFDFLLGSDINPTCEVTHRMRYNEQLGLNTAFLTKDISDPDFIEELLGQIQDQFGDVSIDVLTSVSLRALQVDMKSGTDTNIQLCFVVKSVRNLNTEISKLLLTLLL